MRKFSMNGIYIVISLILFIGGQAFGAEDEFIPFRNLTPDEISILVEHENRRNYYLEEHGWYTEYTYTRFFTYPQELPSDPPPPIVWNYSICRKDEPNFSHRIGVIGHCKAAFFEDSYLSEFIMYQDNGTSGPAFSEIATNNDKTSQLLITLNCNPNQRAILVQLADKSFFHYYDPRDFWFPKLLYPWMKDGNTLAETISKNYVVLNSDDPNQLLVARTGTDKTSDKSKRYKFNRTTKHLVQQTFSNRYLVQLEYDIAGFPLLVRKLQGDVINDPVKKRRHTVTWRIKDYRLVNDKDIVSVLKMPDLPPDGVIARKFRKNSSSWR